MADNEEQIRFSRTCILKIIKLYSELPCLWNRSKLSYKNKDTKEQAWKKMTDLVQKYHPDANRVHVLRKIESLRACHRKERNKVEKARALGKVHKPNLYYYEQLSFLNGSDARRAVPASSADDNEDSNLTHDNKMEFLDVNDTSNEPQDEEYPYRNEDYSSYAFEVENHSQTIDSPEVANFSGNSHTAGLYGDQYDAIGVNVAAKLRNLPQNMRIICEKLINDALFAAQMNKLTAHATIVCDPLK